MKIFIQDDEGKCRPALSDDGGELIVRPDHDEKIFAFENIVVETKENLNADAGFNALNTTAVPVGKIHVITFISVLNNISACGPMQLIAVINGKTLFLLSVNSTTAYIPDTLIGSLYLDAGDYIAANLYSCTAGDDLHLSINGYQMKAP